MESSYLFNIGTDPDFQYKLCAAGAIMIQPSCARTISPHDFVSFLGAHRGTMLVQPPDELDGHAVAREVMFKRLPDFSSKDSDGSILLGRNRFAGRSSEAVKMRVFMRCRVNDELTLHGFSCYGYFAGRVLPERRPSLYL